MNVDLPRPRCPTHAGRTHRVGVSGWRRRESRQVRRDDIVAAPLSRRPWCTTHEVGSSTVAPGVEMLLVPVVVVRLSAQRRRYHPFPVARTGMKTNASGRAGTSGVTTSTSARSALAVTAGAVSGRGNANSRVPGSRRDKTRRGRRRERRVESAPRHWRLLWHCGRGRNVLH